MLVFLLVFMRGSIFAGTLDIDSVMVGDVLPGPVASFVDVRPFKLFLVMDLIKDFESVDTNRDGELDSYEIEQQLTNQYFGGVAILEPGDVAMTMSQFLSLPRDLHVTLE